VKRERPLPRAAQAEAHEVAAAAAGIPSSLFDASLDNAAAPFPSSSLLLLLLPAAC